MGRFAANLAVLNGSNEADSQNRVPFRDFVGIAPQCCRLGELVEALADRQMDVLCVQETRWRSDCRLFGAIGKRYKLFLMGNEAKTDGVGIFVAEKLADSVVRVERHSERILVLKMVLGDRLLNVFSVYAPHAGKPEEEKESFWDNVFHLVSCIPKI